MPTIMPCTQGCAAVVHTCAQPSVSAHLCTSQGCLTVSGSGSTGHPRVIAQPCCVKRVLNTGRAQAGATCVLCHTESHANGGWGTLPATHLPAVTWPAHLARHQQPMHHMLGTLPQRAAPQAPYAGVPHVCQGCEGAALHSAGHMVCPASPIPLPHPPPVATASWLQPPGNLCSVLPPGQGVPALRPGPLAAQL